MRNSYNLKNYEFVFIPKWNIDGYNHYYFTSDRTLFNSNTNRKSKQVLRKYSRGYNLDGKFITINNLRPLISKVEFKSSNIFNNINPIEMFDFLTNL